MRRLPSKPFRPRTLPFSRALLPAALAMAALTCAQAQDLPANTETQIRALLSEKASRNPAQAKMDSHLVHAATILRGQAVSPDLPTPPGELEAVHAGASNMVEVDIKTAVTPDLLSLIRSLGGTVESAFPLYEAVRARMPLLAVERVAERSDVKQIRLAERAHVNGAPGATDGGKASFVARSRAVRAQLTAFFAARKSGGDLPAPALASLWRSLGAAFFAAPPEGVDTYGDVAHEANIARANFNFDGTGVKVGLLSDGVNSLTSEQANGNLPSNLTVISGQAGSGDEGTAMLEIVHTLAPGAQLYFATGNGGAAQMAANIQALASAGCNIIVDDITYFAEGPFQDATIAQAVNTVTAAGVFYFVAAGNSGNLQAGTSGTWQGDFVDGKATLTGITAGETGSYTLHNFGANNYDVLTTPSSVPVIGGSGNETGAYELMWSDPLGASTNDYDLFITDASGNVQGSSTNVQNGTEDPEEDITGSAAVSSACAAGTCRIYVVKHTAAAARTLYISTERGVLSVGTNSATYGHAANSNAFDVAATDARYADPAFFPACSGFTLTCNNGVEAYSSDGPRQMFYNPNGTAITPNNVVIATNGGVVLSKPDITAADAVPTGVAGYNLFAGTSAAAPHVAAIMALVLQAVPTLTPAAVHAAFAANTVNAIDIKGLPALNVGAGVIMAPSAIMAACGYSVGTAQIPAAGGSVSVPINANGACPWTVTGLSPGLTGTASGKGQSTGTLTAAANSTGAPRSGTVALTQGTFSLASGSVTQGAGNNAATLVVTTSATLLTGFTGGAYVQDLTATGGVAPYTWTLVSGAFPLGLSLSGSAIIGTPTSGGPAVTFTLRVTDSASNTATQQFSLTIVSAGGASAPARVGVFSQFVAGGAAGSNNDWDMTMFLQNTSPTAAIPVRLIIHNDDGTTVLKATGTSTAAPTALTVTQQGDVQSGIVGTEIDRVLNPNTTLVVTCGLGQSVNVEGWVDVQAGPNDSNGFGVNGFAVFRRGYVQGLTTGTAGFDSSGPNAAALIPPIEGTVPLQTGLAASTIAMPFDATTANNFFNAVAIGTLSSSVGANIATATFYDQNGNQIGTPQAIAAPAGCTSLCHTAFELSPTASTGAFTGTGTVVFTGTSLIGLGLRGSQYGTLTDVPVVAH